MSTDHYGRVTTIIVLVLLAAALTACGTHSNPELLFPSRLNESAPSGGTILTTQDGESVSVDSFMTQATGVDVVFVGERHGNPASHAVQRRVIGGLVERGRRVSIGFELFRNHQQVFLDQFLNGELSVEVLKQKLKNTGASPRIVEYYREILKYARANDIPLVALKPDRSMVDRFRESLGDTPAKDPQAQFLESLFRDHPSTGRGVSKFIGVQKFWERRMAHNIDRHLRNAERPRTIVVLTGNLHVLYDFGTPSKLTELGTWSQLSTVTVPDSENLENTFHLPEDVKSSKVTPADYVWLIKSTDE